MGDKTRELIQQFPGIVLDEERLEMFGLQKALLPHVAEELQERIVKPGYIEQTNRFRMDAKLKPGERLEELLHGAYPAGQRHESIGQFRHLELPLVHGIDRHQGTDAVVGDFTLDELSGNDTNDLATGLQCRVGEDPH